MKGGSAYKMQIRLSFFDYNDPLRFVEEGFRQKHDKIVIFLSRTIKLLPLE